jgi:hypothetical protein
MAYLPADIANRALDALAYDGGAIGDLEEGTTAAKVCLRSYGECLRQLLQAAHWDFARQQSPMTLLADATGQTPNVATNVIQPWIYEYAYPINCMKARFVPWTLPINPGSPVGNISQPITPIPGTTTVPFPGGRLRPTRFLVATDPNYPSRPGQIFWETQGSSPQGSTVILSNVQNAQLVYTALMLYPSVWSPLFRAAMVAYLASEVALPLTKDRKLGIAMRDGQIKIAKDKIEQARISDGNEGWASSDIPVDWMQARRTGGGFRDWAGGDAFADSGGGGCLWGGWNAIGWADGSAY